jgi:hypothetical protein
MTRKAKAAKGRPRQGKPLPLGERLLRIGKDCAERFGPEYRALNHDELLYDKDGLPRSDRF